MKYTIVDTSPIELTFDYKNPRISEFNITKKTPEREIIRILWFSMSVEEIVLSIKASGFFQNEPLIAVIEEGKKIVIEGNRRLAAIKCIVDPTIAGNIGVNKNIFQITNPSILETLRTIPVIFLDKREDAWKYIGFKHINGPAKWGSYAKAQYISQIKNEYGFSLEEIASQIGDTHRTVQRLYQGLKVIDQAESTGKFSRTSIDAPRLYFSHLYTGLSYEGYRNYLGIPSNSEESDKPVPSEKIDNLIQLLEWLYGNKDTGKKSVITSQNPDLKLLESVLSNSEATFALKDGVALQLAYDISQPKDITFEQSLLEAKRALQKTQSYLTEGFDGNNTQLLKQAGTVAEIAEDIYDNMEKKWKSLQPDNDVKQKRLFSED